MKNRIEKSCRKSCTKAKNLLLLPSQIKMVIVAQLVRASDCGSEGRGFEPRFSPKPLKEGVTEI